MRKLPHWCLTDKFPGFYDTESGTAIEQTAKVYKAMNELIEEYNLWIDKVNVLIENFIKDTSGDYEIFKVAMRQEFQDFIDVVNLKIQSQDTVIADAVDYMKNNLRTSIRELISGLRVTGELNEDIIACFDDFASQITAEQTARKTADENLNKLITNLAIEFQYNTNDESLAIDMAIVEGSNNVIYTAEEEKIDII